MPETSPAGAAHTSSDGRERLPVLLVVDGHALAYRAWHATPATMTSGSGEPTGAVHGFLSMLLTLISARGPSGVVVCFDAGRDRRRTALWPGYKATRSAPPETLRPQVARIGEILDALGIGRVAIEGVEADDVIATVTRTALERGWEVEIVTGDRDALQLVSDRVRMLAPGRSMRELAVLDPEAVEVRYGVTPRQYLDLASLRGDVSDNLPGVAGVGPKTAAELLARYGSVAGLYDHLDELSPRRAESLAAGRDAVERNLVLMKLVDDLELPVPVETLIRPWVGPVGGEAARRCRQLGLVRIADRIDTLS